MSPALRSALLGTERSTALPVIWLGAMALVSLTTFAGYASGVFAPTGGVIWIPYAAVAVGAVATATVGFLRGGAILGWLVMFAAIWGFHIDHALLGFPSRPLAARLTYLVRPDGLVWFGVSALIVGAVPYLFGVIVRWGTDSMRRRDGSPIGD